jgi:hypothetical protein
MQLRIYAAGILFLGSYLPLSAILLVQNFRYDLWGSEICTEWRPFNCITPLRQPIISLSFVAICLACFVFTLIVLNAIKVRQQAVVSEVKHIPTDLMNYVLPYVVSFMGIDYNDIGKFVGFIVFLVWIFIITYKSERAIMNPVLTVFGWKLFEIRHSSPGGQVISTSIALSRINLNPGDTYKVNAVQDVLVVK